MQSNIKLVWIPILMEKLDRNKIRQLRENLKKVGIESRPFLAGDFSRQPVNNKFEHIVSSSNNVKLFDESAIALALSSSSFC